MGMPLPASIKAKPSIQTGLEFYWKAYCDLTSDRDVGMGVGPIPWQAMNEWAWRHQVYEDNFERLVMVLRGVDKAFMDKQGKKNKHGSAIGGKSFEKPTGMGAK